MEIKQFVIEKEEFRELAEVYFQKNSHLDLTTERDCRLFAMGKDVFDRYFSAQSLRVATLFAENPVLQKRCLLTAGKEFYCRYFERLSEKQIRGVFFFLLTAGEGPVTDSENVMDGLLCDIWRTSFVDAGMEILEKKLQKSLGKIFPGQSVYLSQIMGPGYYGMDLSEAEKIFSLLNGKNLGLSMKNGILIPEKSCAGFFLVSGEDLTYEETACKLCMGNTAGCGFCRKAK